MKSADYIDLLRPLTETGSDYAVGKLLGISQDAINRYRKGSRYLDDYACLIVAEALNIPIEKVLADVALERETDPTKRARWSTLLKKLEAAAMVVFGFAAALAVSLATGQQSQSTERVAFNKCQIHPRSVEARNINYARFMRWLRRLVTAIDGQGVPVSTASMHPT